MNLLDLTKEYKPITNTWNSNWRKNTVVGIHKKVKKPKKEKKRKTRIIPVSYETYIKSNVWINRRNEYWKRHKKVCAVCLSTIFVELHHAKYSEYNGKDKDNHLFPLCKSCHLEFHQEYGSSGDMLQDTKFFILSKRY